MDTVAVSGRRTTRLRITGTALLLLAALLFVGSFFATAKTPTGHLVGSCTGDGIPCDARPDSSNRERVFFLWMGATLYVFAGGIWLRSVGNRDAQ
jgi:hypothetical protein